MQGTTGGTLGDLFAATETVGEDQPVVGSLADGGKKFHLADGDGEVVLFGFEAERAGHAAAPGGRSLEVNAEAAQDGLFGRHFHQGFVMAVSMEECFAIEAGQREVLRSGFEEFT